MGRVGACADNAAMESFLALQQNNVLNKKRWHSRQEIRLEIVVAGASLAIELTQMAASRLAHSGHLADINDWLTNILGGIIGYGLFVLATRSKTIAGFVQRFRWPTRARVSSQPV